MKAVEQSPQPLRLAGMALCNGLLIHGPTHWSAAARTVDGELKTASGRKPRFALRSTHVPGLRGLVRLAEALAVLPIVKRNFPEAQLPFEEPRLGAAMATTSAISTIVRKSIPYSGRRELTLGAVGLAPAIFALRGSDLAAYHGAEHKAIGAYERGLADAADATKEHERCGSNLVVPMLVASLVGNLLLRTVVKRPGQIAQLVASLVGTGAAIELFIWAERHPDSRFTTAIRWPGFEIQRHFVTREPTDEQLDVSRAALAEILRAEEPKPMVQEARDKR